MRKCEYVWTDVNGICRSKTKVLPNVLNVKTGLFDVEIYPDWNYDGSSTGQAQGMSSEVILKPVVIYNDPFRSSISGDVIVLCETFNPDLSPHNTNTRHHAADLFERNKDQLPMFGIEQEFFIFKNGKSIYWNELLERYGRLAETGCLDPPGHEYDPNMEPEAQGKYYCGVGGDCVIGRQFIEKAFDNCLKAGLTLTGLNAEVAPGQWEFQICATGIAAADQLTIMRYILNRTAEEYGWQINFEPKPISGDWNGSGCHTNFSTNFMREEGGLDVIMSAIKKLEDNHGFHMENYGSDNKLRMTGLHETSSFDKFTFGVADRTASVRIPRETYKNKKGYFEDRRPSSNMDPYIVTSLIFETCSSIN